MLLVFFPLKIGYYVSFKSLLKIITFSLQHESLSNAGEGLQIYTVALRSIIEQFAIFTVPHVPSLARNIHFIGASPRTSVTIVHVAERPATEL